MRRPCLDCNQPTSNGSRCPTCQRTHNQQRNRRRTWYQSGWAAISRQARTQQPWCSACGATHLPLQADHIQPRSLAAGIRVLCQPCHQKLGEHSSQQ